MEIKKTNMLNNNWKIWEKSPEYGKALYYKSAIGEADEMESAKAMSKILAQLYSKGMKVLDVGCGAGHYLRSFRSRLDKDIDYTGLDATQHFIDLAKEAFKDTRFIKGNIFNLDIEDNSYDLVVSSNVILHLPPPPDKAIKELVRVSKKYVVIRTVFGERNYIIKEVRGDIDKEGEPSSFNFFNMYTEEYIRNVLKGLKVEVVKDDMWKPFDNRKEGGETATRIVNGMQVSGNLILDWRFIIIEK